MLGSMSERESYVGKYELERELCWEVRVRERVMLGSMS
jgi:hypothetical protein